MEKKLLLESAAKLNVVKELFAEQYAAKCDQMASVMNKMMRKRKDLAELVGENNEEMMCDNHANHARFMASIFKEFSADVLVETILWVFRAYRSHGFSTTYWAAQLNLWIETIKQELSPEALAEILPYYKWMQTNIPVFVVLSDEKLEAEFSKH